MNNITEKLEDLIVQATKERSHYYVASCAREAITEIKRLRTALNYIKQVVEKAT